MNIQNGLSDSPDRHHRAIVVLRNSDCSYKPFYHALRIAFSLKGVFEILDIRNDNETVEHISVRSSLEAWQLIQHGKSYKDIEALGLRIKRIIRKGNKRKNSVNQFKDNIYNLTVLGTESRKSFLSGKKRILVPDLCEYIDGSLLLISQDMKSFVDDYSGKFLVRSILLLVLAPDHLHSISDTIVYFRQLFENDSIEFNCYSAYEREKQIKAECKEYKWVELPSEKSGIHTANSIAKKVDADLIVLHAINRDYYKNLQRVAQALIQNAPCPILINVK